MDYFDSMIQTQMVPDKFLENSSDLSGSPQSRLWHVLMRNIQRWLDEIYKICGEDRDYENTMEIIKLLQFNERKFILLSELLKFNGVECSDNDYDRMPHPDVENKDHLSNQRAHSSNLRVEAPPFIPSSVVALTSVQLSTYIASDEVTTIVDIPHPELNNQTEGDDSSNQEPNNKIQNSDALSISTEMKSESGHQLGDQQIPTAETDFTEPNSELNKLVGSNKHQMITRGRSFSVDGTSDTKSPHILRSKRAERSISCQSEHSPRTNHVKKPLKFKVFKTTGLKQQSDAMDEETEAEVEQASEPLWAAVEAWVEAEARAEEEAWHLLRLKKRQSHDEGDPGNDELDPTSLRADPGSDSDNEDAFGLDEPDVRYGIDGGQRVTRGTVRGSEGSFFTEAESGDSEGSLIASDERGGSPVPSPPVTPEIADEEGSQEDKSGLGSLQGTPRERGHRVSPSKSIHEKLTAADRDRDKRLTPEATLRKLEARQEAAETNRSLYVSGRVEKARQSASRSQAIFALAARKVLSAHKAYLERIREAEKRREEYVSQIKGKAENELAKVSEIMFINSLNAEAVGQELQQKLSEVEARIVAGRQRRTEILENITGRQRRRGQQMSAVRHQLEKDRMERWERLENRLNSVKSRRDMRLLEMQNHDDLFEHPNLEEAKSGIMSPVKEDDDFETPSLISTDVKLIDFINKNKNSNVSSGNYNKTSKRKLKRSRKSNAKSATDNSETVLALDIDDFFSSRTSDVNDLLRLDLFVEEERRNQDSANLWENLHLISKSLKDTKQTPNKFLKSLLDSIGKVINSVLDGLNTINEELLVESIVANGKTSSSAKSSKKKNKKGAAKAITTDLEVTMPWSRCTDLLLQSLRSVDLTKVTTVESFVSGGGVLAIRVLLDRHLGVLRDGATWKEIWSSKSIRDGLSAALDALSTSIYRGGPGVETIVTTGLHLSLLDMCQVLLAGLEKWQRERCQIRRRELVRQEPRSSVSDNQSNKLRKQTRTYAVDNRENQESSRPVSHSYEWPDELTPLISIYYLLSALLSPHTKNPSKKRSLIALNEFNGVALLPTVFRLTLESLGRIPAILSQEELDSDQQKLIFQKLVCRQVLLISNFVRTFRIENGVEDGHDFSRENPVESTVECKMDVSSRLQSSIGATALDEVCNVLICLMASALLLKGYKPIHASGTGIPLDLLQLCQLGLSTLCDLGRIDIQLIQRLPLHMLLSLRHSFGHLLGVLIPLQEAALLDITLSHPNTKGRNVISTVMGNEVYHGSNQRLESKNFPPQALLAESITNRIFYLLCIITWESSKNQELFGRGPHPTVLYRICNLPLRYFSDNSLKAQVIPCLASMCLSCSTNSTIMASQMSSSVVSKFFTSNQYRQIEVDTNNVLLCPVWILQYFNGKSLEEVEKLFQQNECR